MDTWIRYIEKPSVKGPIAVAASKGLRSIGKIAIEYLIKELKPKPIADLYSYHLPLIHQTRPSYIAHPELPGEAGVKLRGGRVEIPRVRFYLSKPERMLLTRGYHANFKGQYEVADKVLEFYEELGVRRVIVLAGYGGKADEVCCAATSLSIIEEMKKYGVETGYEGPFFGFSGLILGLAKLRNMEALCLFGKTTPKPENPEYPDRAAAKAVLSKLSIILNLSIDLSKLERRMKRKARRAEAY